VRAAAQGALRLPLSEGAMTQDRDEFWFLNSRVAVRCAASGGASASVTEHQLARGDSPPLHLHEREDEIFHVLEGEVRLRIGETEATARAGDIVVAPRGAPHSYRVESDHARVLVIATAGDFEAMMREVARPAGAGLPPAVEPTPAMVEALTAAAARHHISIIGPPLAA